MLTYAVYVDHNVSSHIVGELRVEGHDVVTVKELGTSAATDDHHLLQAAQDRRVLLTNNVADFELLHDAWRRWPVDMDHAGVLILFQSARPEVMVRELIGFLASRPVLRNRLYKWRPRSGWLMRP